MKNENLTLFFLAVIYILLLGDNQVSGDNQTKFDTLSQIEIVEEKQPIENIERTPKKEEYKILKKGFGEDDGRQDLINYAYNLGGKDFVLTLDGENAQWTIDRRSMIIGANGHYDLGLCQLNTKRHSKFINSKDFQNPYRQIDYCWEVWQDAVRKGRLTTTFYAYNVRYKRVSGFEFLQ